MRIRETGSDCTISVYGIYWAEYQGVLQRFHFVIPEEGYPGFLAVPESECELVDPNISKFVLVKNARNSDLLIHQSLCEDDLLDRIIDHDPEAMIIFLEKLSTKETPTP